MDTIWKSELSDGVKIGFFRAAVETVLLYGSTAWTLTQSLDKKLDGAYAKNSECGVQYNLAAAHYK